MLTPEEAEAAAVEHAYWDQRAEEKAERQNYRELLEYWRKEIPERMALRHQRLVIGARRAGVRGKVTWRPSALEALDAVVIELRAAGWHVRTSKNWGWDTVTIEWSTTPFKPWWRFWW